MRTILTVGGIQTFISTSEAEFLESHDTHKINNDELTEREQEIAFKLCSNGILNRHIRSGKLHYTLNVNKLKG